MAPVFDHLKRIWFDLHWQARDCQVKLATVDALAYRFYHLRKCVRNFNPEVRRVKKLLVAHLDEEIERDLNIVRTIPFHTASVSFSLRHFGALD